LPTSNPVALPDAAAELAQTPPEQMPLRDKLIEVVPPLKVHAPPHAEDNVKLSPPMANVSGVATEMDCVAPKPTLNAP
jgi:hypothetical protein